MSTTQSAEKPMTVCALILSCLLLPAIANAQSPKPVFSMAVFLDSNFGDEIESGKIDAAIEALEADTDSNSDAFARSNNLCVAYIKAKDLKKATGACDEALRIAQDLADSFTDKRFVARETRYRLREDLAVALSNQGVVLALNGKPEEAEMLFQESIETGRRDRMVRNNLKRLSYSPYVNDEQED